MRVKVALEDEHVLFTSGGSKAFTRLWKKIQEHSTNLGTIAHVNFGKQLRDRKKHQQDVVKVASARRIRPPYKPCYTGRDIGRYSVRWGNLACLDDEVARSGGCWHPDKQNAKRKLLTRQIGRFPEFGIDLLGYQCLNTVFMVNLKRDDIDPLFVLGQLNSRLIRALWLRRFYDQRRTFPKIKGTYLKQLPICETEGCGENGDAAYRRMVALVETSLALYEQLKSARTDQDQVVIHRQIDATDRQIDQLVYDLYGLTEAEIGLVEEATAPPGERGTEGEEEA